MNQISAKRKTHEDPHYFPAIKMLKIAKDEELIANCTRECEGLLRNMIAEKNEIKETDRVSLAYLSANFKVRWQPKSGEVSVKTELQPSGVGVWNWDGETHDYEPCPNCKLDAGFSSHSPCRLCDGTGRLALKPKDYFQVEFFEDSGIPKPCNIPSLTGLVFLDYLSQVLEVLEIPLEIDTTSDCYTITIDGDEISFNESRIHLDEIAEIRDAINRYGWTFDVTEVNVKREAVKGPNIAKTVVLGFYVEWEKSN